MSESFFFAWEGANHPNGPWRHMDVLEFHGKEALSSLYSFAIDLVRHGDAPDVDATDLVGKSAALRIATGTAPEFRIVHGIIASAEELGEVDGGSRYRVVLAPPFLRATMMHKSVIYLEKTIKEIVDQVLTRTSWGAGLALSTSDGDPAADDGDMTVFRPAKATYAWRVVNQARIADRMARAYCVQYGETDFAFASRLLEEEGIAYHFEHTRDECILVLSDFDGGRTQIDSSQPLGPDHLGREIVQWRAGGRVRPKSYSLHDYNWQKPNLELLAVSSAGSTEFQTHEEPGRYEHSKETGTALADVRQQRLDTERAWAAGEGRCRLLGAGDVFRLDHPNDKFNGKFLVTAIEHIGYEHDSFSASAGSDQQPYVNRFECVRCGTKDAEGESNFRPARVTPRPRIIGSQTAIITAEPSAPEAEINVGGPGNIGCVRVRFHWDLDAGRLAKEPSSCWVRVSQMFAGASHGALWNPRVGNEVIVDFLDGDPDRPIVTGRVYNGLNAPPDNPTARPTYSAIKSLTSPQDGNFNLIAFEDKQGAEQIIIHAARDFVSQVKHDGSRSVGNNDATTVAGNQTIKVAGSQSTTAGSAISMNAGTDLSANAGANMKLDAAADVTASAGATMALNAGAMLKAEAPIVAVTAGGQASVKAPMVSVEGAANVAVAGAMITAAGAVVIVTGSGAISIKGGTVKISGSTVNVEGSAEVNVKGGVVNLNS